VTTVKVTTEKRPKSTLALEIELDQKQLERELDQAARRLSQKYPIHGFRPGKAPRFIIERTYGREALIEEATDNLINKSYREAIEQEQITPVGPPALETITSTDPFSFRVLVPIPPKVTIGDYRAIRAPLAKEEITDEQLDYAMETLRDKHVVLKELDEPRPAQAGDQLKVRLQSSVDGKPLDEQTDEPAEQDLDLVQGRLIDELFEGLIGSAIGDKKEIQAQMAEDHANEQIRGKTVTFNIEITGMQERLLPDWEDLPSLEDFEGSLDELREKTRKDLEESQRNAAERDCIDNYIEQLVAQTEYDIPDVMVHDLAESMLEDQGRQFSRYGITLDQMLQYRGQTRESAIEDLLPDAEKQTRVTLALREIVTAEQLTVDEDEITADMQKLLEDYPEEERENVAQILSSQLRSTIANSVLDRKLREQLLAIATGTVETETPAAEPVAEEAQAATDETPAAEPAVEEAQANTSEQAEAQPDSSKNA
jgi:trigger factor